MLSVSKVPHCDLQRVGWLEEISSQGKEAYVSDVFQIYSIMCKTKRLFKHFPFLCPFNFGRNLYKLKRAETT